MIDEDKSQYNAVCRRVSVRPSVTSRHCIKTVNVGSSKQRHMIAQEL